MPAGTAVENIKIMKTLGAEVNVQPLVAMFDASHFYNKAKQITRELEDAVCLDQVIQMAFGTNERLIN